MKSFDFYIDFHFVNLFNSSFSSGILGLKEPRTPILKKKNTDFNEESIYSLRLSPSQKENFEG